MKSCSYYYVHEAKQSCSETKCPDPVARLHGREFIFGLGRVPELPEAGDLHGVHVADQRTCQDGTWQFGCHLAQLVFM